MSEKSHRLKQIILAKIQANSDKRITFAEFMRLGSLSSRLWLLQFWSGGDRK